MGYARVIVSAHMFLDAFNFPKGTEVKHVSSHDGSGFCDIEVTLSHPDIPTVIEEGQLPPVVSPSFRRQEPVVFVDWGIK